MEDIRAIAEIILSTYRFVVVVAVLIAVVCIPRTNSFHKYLITYLCLTGGMEIFGYILGYVIKTSNHIIVPLSALVDLCFFSALYRRFLLKQKNLWVTLLSAMGILYILFEIFYNFIYQTVSAKDFQPYAKPVTNSIIVILTLTFLYEKMSSYTESKLANFTFNNTVLVYFTLSTIFFLPFNFLVNESSGIKFYFWSANIALILFFYVYLAVKIFTNAYSAKK